ncbi:MAG: carotenoid oxygenase family protein [Pseudomonadota bacterium]
MASREPPYPTARRQTDDRSCSASSLGAGGARPRRRLPGPIRPWTCRGVRTTPTLAVTSCRSSAKFLPASSSWFRRAFPRSSGEPTCVTAPTHSSSRSRWMDGDGMIHAVYLDAGRPRYRNRFVRTRDLAVEQRAGRAVYGSFSKPTPVDPKLLRAGDNTGPYKNGAFITSSAMAAG